MSAPISQPRYADSIVPAPQAAAAMGEPLDAELESAAPRLRHVPNAVSAIVLFAGRLVAAIVQLRLVDHYWGGAYTGLNALSNQVLLYVMLLELGLSQSAITLLYEPIVRRQHQRVSGMVSALRHDVRLLAMVGAALILPAVALYARSIHGTLPYGLVLSTLGCVVATGLVQLTAVHFQAYLNAAEQLDKVNYTFAGGYLLKTAIGLPLAIYWHNYLLLPATIAALTLGEFAALRLAFYRACPQFRPGPWRDEARRIRTRAKYVLIQRVAGVAYYQSDFIILSLTTSLVAVRDYAKFQYVSAALLSVVGLVAASLATSIARLQMRHPAENRRRQYVTAQLAISMIGAVMMLAFWFTAGTVVTLVFGHDPGVGRRVVALFGAALFLNIVKSVDDIFIMAKGAFEISWWISAIEVPVYVVSGVLLSRRLGFEGILLASIATNVVVSIVLKGIVLAGPVFDSTRGQWYWTRLASMGQALAMVAPLAAMYALAPRVVHVALFRFGATNALAAAYMLAGLALVLRGARRREASE